MASEPVRAMPTELVHGDSIRWRLDSDPLHPAASWTPELEIIGPTQVTLLPVADGAGWIITLSADVSADELVAGTYRWALQYESNDGQERHTSRFGQLEVVADPADLSPPADVRTFARKALDACEAAILAKADSTSFSVFGRSYTFGSHLEMLEYRNRLRGMVDAEEEEGRIESGEPSQRTAWVRF